MPPPQYLDSPGGPSSSTQDRGFDPLNMLDEESVRSKDPRTWTVPEVMDFLAAIGCQDHATTFQKQVCVYLYLQPHLHKASCHFVFGSLRKRK